MEILSSRCYSFTKQDSTASMMALATGSAGKIGRYGARLWRTEQPTRLPDTLLSAGW
jgi:hypothetical protein